MPDLIRRAHLIAEKHGLEVVCFGHAGDGNIHIDFVRRQGEDAAWEAGIGPAIRAVLEATVDLFGTITGEHGVGVLRREDVSLQIDRSTLEAMRKLKRGWDEHGLLNPGKIWRK
ncbi:MAG: hypothetical protein O7E54_04055 [Planctomycetota bacterium]|nr:hypothetical protein [Planctomycetota bacterium]